MSRNGEGRFQRRVIEDLETRFPGCIVMKQDASYKRGIPDLVVFYNNKWAMLEVKLDGKAHHQELQDYWVNKADKMSFARFIFPENKEEVLSELEEEFGRT